MGRMAMDVLQVGRDGIPTVKSDYQSDLRFVTEM